MDTLFYKALGIVVDNHSSKLEKTLHIDKIQNMVKADKYITELRELQSYLYKSHNKYFKDLTMGILKGLVDSPESVIAFIDNINKTINDKQLGLFKSLLTAYSIDDISLFKNIINKSYIEPYVRNRGDKQHNVSGYHRNAHFNVDDDAAHQVADQSEENSKDQFKKTLSALNAHFFDSSLSKEERYNACNFEIKDLLKHLHKEGNEFIRRNSHNFEDMLSKLSNPAFAEAIALYFMKHQPRALTMNAESISSFAEAQQDVPNDSEFARELPVLIKRSRLDDAYADKLEEAKCGVTILGLCHLMTDSGVFKTKKEAIDFLEVSLHAENKKANKTSTDLVRDVAYEAKEDAKAIAPASFKEKPKGFKEEEHMAAKVLSDAVRHIDTYFYLDVKEVAALEKKYEDDVNALILQGKSKTTKPKTFKEVFSDYFEEAALTTFRNLLRRCEDPYPAMADGVKNLQQVSDKLTVDGEFGKNTYREMFGFKSFEMAQALYRYLIMYDNANNTNYSGLAHSKGNYIREKLDEIENAPNLTVKQKIDKMAKDGMALSTIHSQLNAIKLIKDKDFTGEAGEVMAKYMANKYLKRDGIDILNYLPDSSQSSLVSSWSKDLLLPPGSDGISGILPQSGSTKLLPPSPEGNK